MIRSIRKKHQLIWLILAILLPVIFIAAIAFRHSEPVNENVPKRISSQQTQSSQR